MPDPKQCGAKFPVGSKAYRDCINYRGVNKRLGTSPGGGDDAINHPKPKTRKKWQPGGNPWTKRR